EVLRNGQYESPPVRLYDLTRRRVVVGNRFYFGTMLTQMRQQIRRTLGVRHHQGYGLVRLGNGTLQGERQNRPHDQRPEQRPEYQRGDQSPAIAQILPEFLPEYAQNGPHYDRPSPVPINRTNASSRLLPPVCARSSSGVPAATTVPCAMTTTSSQSAPTSCIT